MQDADKTVTEGIFNGGKVVKGSYLNMRRLVSIF